MAPKAAITVDADCDEQLCRARTGEPVRFENASSGTVRRTRWDFSDGRTSRSRSASHQWSEPGFYLVTLWVSDGGERESTASLRFLVEAGEPAGACQPDAVTRCFQDSRFAVEMDWWTGGDQSGSARVVHEGTDDSGLLYFFEPGDNWEVLIKVLDGCAVNGHVWVFGASATTLGYSIRVTDTVTGEMREYRNEDGTRSPAITDTGAFPNSCGNAGASASLGTSGSGVAPIDPAAGLVAVASASADGGCTETATSLCLLGSRYEVSMRWSTVEGEEGVGRVLRPRTADSGLFYFFGPDNWEMLVKVLDGCHFNGRDWVFAASATDVGLDLVVRDTVTGEVRNYTKDPGVPARAIVDVGAFTERCQ